MIAAAVLMISTCWYRPVMYVKHKTLAFLHYLKRLDRS